MMSHNKNHAAGASGCQVNGVRNASERGATKKNGCAQLPLNGRIIGLETGFAVLPTHEKFYRLSFLPAWAQPLREYGQQLNLTFIFYMVVVLIAMLKLAGGCVNHTSRTGGGL